MMLLKCLKCEAELDVIRDRCTCPQCGAEWPVSGGIPRFFQAPTYYWGEISRNESRDLLDAARKGSWAEAVRARFPEKDNMTFNILDHRRASWAAMLGIDERSVALDIGSGYGAITHSLSRLAGEVYSIEAIPERIEFTQERLRQEGVRNVRLIQASATALPLVDNSFDLVVTNGVLEWVGEWDLEGDPRCAQLRFLNRISRLLKDDGLLVIGIENRFGYGLFLGGNDHSAIPYTSLVPRRVASFMLRHSSKLHHRTQLNKNKEYRTYTYSEQGYHKLLAEAGFGYMSSYWAEPGYNQPYHLVPLSMPQWVREQFLDLLDHPTEAPRRSWRRSLKRAIAASGFLPLVVPEFLLLASKRLDRRTRVQSWVEERIAALGGKGDPATHPQPITWALDARGPVSIVRVGDQRSGRALAYIKASVGDQNGAASSEAALANRTKIRDSLETVSQAVGVPQAYGGLLVGNTSYWMEAAAQGTQLGRLVRRLGYFTDAGRVESDFGRFFGGLIDFTEALQNVSAARPMNSSWREIPAELENLPGARAAIEGSRYFGGRFSNSSATWIQHGDLSVENIFLDQKTGRLEVIDWTDLAGGFPPLYDFFQLFYSTGYLIRDDETMRFPSEAERWIASFNAIFFSDSRFARMVREFILRACERLKVEPEQIPSLLVEFLLIRTHYYRARSVVQRRVHLRLLQLCLEGNRSVFGRFQLRRAAASP